MAETTTNRTPTRLSLRERWTSLKEVSRVSMFPRASFAEYQQGGRNRAVSAQVVKAYRRIQLKVN
jgi:hypothetical protein